MRFIMRTHTLAHLKIRTAMLFVLSAAVFTLGTLAPRLQAQTPAPVEKFEVASLKMNKAAPGRGGWQNLPGGRFTATSMNLRALLRIAYGIDTLLLPQQQIVGGPAWIDTDRFDIDAKAATEHDTDARVARTRSLAMLRSLLEERFKMTAHLEKRPTPTYALILLRSDGKLGPDLKPSTVDCEAVAQDPVQRCGLRSSGPGSITARGVTMAQIASFLQISPAVARVVTDQTGLKGRFDLRIEFAPPFLLGPGGSVPNPAAETGISLPTALQDQLGLKLDSRREPVETLIIDSISKLSEGGVVAPGGKRQR